MSMKVAAEDSCPVVAAWLGKKDVAVAEIKVVVREYDEKRDKVAVEAMEKQCEVGQKGKPSLIADLLGDPLCRIRHFPLHLMLVAESSKGEIVGVIRGCIKTVVRGSSDNYAKVGNILGLRVSPTHRRLGIGLRLVQELEDWCCRNSADYTYMATDSTNKASVNLFLGKCGYVKFCTPSMLVQPVHAHRCPLSSDKTAIIRITPRLAESIYQKVFSDSEFFPKDIDAVLTNKLNLGTFIAVPKKLVPMWNPKIELLPPSYAVLSIWNTKELFKFRVEGVSGFKKVFCLGSRKIDSWLPWLKIPSFPDVFKPFGVYFLYGLLMGGEDGPSLMKTLCAFAHNMARDDEACGAVVTEVDSWDPVRVVVPHWRRFSWSEDFWCVKKLAKDNDHDDPGWFSQSRPLSPVLFVDPRDV